MDLDTLVKHLTVASIVSNREGHNDAAATLLELRKMIYDGTPTVWSNGRAFRKYQGQDKGDYANPKEGWNKFKVIMIKED